jgi:parallel beta-helix repeat protein
VRHARPTRARAFGLLLLACAAWSPGLAEAQVTCTRYAAPFGSDAATGGEGDPFATVGRLLESVGPGETGCLFGGVYVEDVKVTTGGSPGSPLVLASRPGSRATLRGRLWIAEGAGDVLVTALNLDGRNAGRLPSPTVNGDRIVFRGNDVTNYHTGICFVLGSSSGWGIARDVVLEGNRIHDCGRLPATNHEHGVYVESARGARIVDNLIYDNADRGIQLYPDAQDTVVAHNVIDGNGEGMIFSGEGGSASSGNRVTDNVITNALLRFNVESWWPVGNPVGTGNIVERNCLWNGRHGNVAPEIGFVARDNIVADPGFRSRAAKDFALPDGSPCAGLGPREELRFGPLPAVAPKTLAPPRIVGRSERRSLLRLRPGSWSGSGTLRFAYRWRRCDARGAGCRSIRRSRGTTAYRLRRADAGHTIRALVSVRNSAGARTAVSRPTRRVKG